MLSSLLQSSHNIKPKILKYVSTAGQVLVISPSSGTCTPAFLKLTREMLSDFQLWLWKINVWIFTGRKEVLSYRSAFCAHSYNKLFISAESWNDCISWRSWTEVVSIGRICTDSWNVWDDRICGKNELWVYFFKQYWLIISPNDRQTEGWLSSEVTFNIWLYILIWKEMLYKVP